MKNKDKKKRYFVLNPKSAGGYGKGTFGFVMVNGRAERLSTEETKDKQFPCFNYDLERDAQNGHLREVPAAEFVLCCDDVIGTGEFWR